MSRRHAAEKRQILPDAKFGDMVLSKFMNNLMVDGKKSPQNASSITRLIALRQKSNVRPWKCSTKRWKTSSPPSKCVRAALVVPRTRFPLKCAPSVVEALAIRWLIKAARSRNENTMEERLAGELMDAVQSRGTAVKKREDTHKMAEANKAFSHYRW